MSDSFVADSFVADPISNSASPGAYLLSMLDQSRKFAAGTLPKESPLADLSQMMQQSSPMRSIDALAGAGRLANQAIQSGAGAAAEGFGRIGVPPALAAGAATIPATLSEATIPKDRLGVLMTAAGLGQGQEAAEKKLADQLAASARASGKAPVLQAGPIQKVTAGALGVESAIRPKYANAIVADPTIISEETPLPQEVGKLYKNYFEENNMKFDSAKYKEVFGSRYVPTDAQAGRLRNMVEGVMNNIESGESVKNEDLILAKSALSRLQDTQAALTTPKLMSQYAADEARIGEALTAGGDSRLIELDRMYFRAKAKEAASSILPQNKNMSPNALRGYLMLNMLAESAGSLAEGHPIRAAFSGAKAAAMSPYLATQAIGSLSGTPGPLAQGLGMNLLGNRHEQ